MTVTFDIPGLRLRLQTNNVGTTKRGTPFWAVRAREAREQRRLVGLAWLASVGRGFPGRPPFVVTLTRIGRGWPDYSNAVTSLKHVQDEVAARLGVDDGDESKIGFVYGREKGPYGVRIRIQSWPPTGEEQRLPAVTEN